MGRGYNLGPIYSRFDIRSRPRFHIVHELFQCDSASGAYIAIYIMLLLSYSTLIWYPSLLFASNIFSVFFFCQYETRIFT